jgi:hypothetical protein
MRTIRITAVVLWTVLPALAQFCEPSDFDGAYGFQLSGSTTISGTAKPVASVGWLEFDGEGGVSGTSSVNFAGFLLGNPVTGTYQLRSDCTIVWSLQDDSGAFQHFAGVLSSDLQGGTFRQTDPGGAQRGTLSKAAPECSESGIRGTYDFTISGSAIPMGPGETPGKISLEGILVADAAGNLARLENGAATPAGTAAVDSDCIVNISFTLSGGAAMKFRGVLVNGGKEILAIETDPGAAVNARLRAR